MTHLSHNQLQLSVRAALMGIAFSLAMPLFAQPAASNTSPNGNVSSTTPAARPTQMDPPLPPVFKPPVEFFRDLLSMGTAERNAALTNHTPEDRKLILAKVREYKAMKPDQRELRLQATELSWYLLRLMRTSETNRVAVIKSAPENCRKLLEYRMQIWDSFTPEIRKDFLDNRAAVKAFLELAAGALPHNTFANLTPERRQALEKSVQQIQGMPENQRQKLLNRFNQFFDLTPQEKERALTTISEQERQLMEKTLHSYGQLTPVQRAKCIRSFEKFAGLTAEERNQFLKNAERWKLMTPDQRQAWREVVSQVPLIPSGRDTPPIPKAPVPRPSRNSPTIATNRS